MTTQFDLDTRHIQMVADEALLDRRRGKRPLVASFRQDGRAYVSVFGRIHVRPVRTALRRAGYELGPADATIREAGTPLRIEVTGWSIDALQARRAGLATDVNGLTASLESTVSNAIAAYRRARTDGFEPDVARGQAYADIEEELRADLREDVGPLVHKTLAPDHPDVRRLVERNATLYGRLMYLLNGHLRLARKTIDRYAELQSVLPADQADRRTLAAMRPRIDELQERFDRTAVEERFSGAYAYVCDHAIGLASAFADWYVNEFTAPDAPAPDEVFRAWAATQWTDHEDPASTRAAAADPTQVAAADFPAPPAHGSDDAQANPPSPTAPGHAVTRGPRGGERR